MNNNLQALSWIGEFSAQQKKMFLLLMSMLLFSVCGGVGFYCFVVIFDTSAQHSALHASSFFVC